MCYTSVFSRTQKQAITVSKQESLLNFNSKSPPGPQGKYSFSFLGHTVSSKAEQTRESDPTQSSLQQSSKETIESQQHCNAGKQVACKLPTGPSACSASCSKLPALPHPAERSKQDHNNCLILRLNANFPMCDKFSSITIPRYLYLSSPPLID